MKTRNEPERIDISRVDVLAEAFSVENVRFTLKRMASTNDKDNLVAHPLRAAVLIEFEDHLVNMISRLVVDGLWSPSASYVCFTNKRSGNYRELVFPCLIDSVIGRRAIDVLEPWITEDDNGRVFCGRSHASSNRQPGDYENWFQTWLDFSARIAIAAKGEKLAYVFDTDVADFFPSIDRQRAKQFLAQRTGAHTSLIEMIFYCLEAWLPRFYYMQMTGLPIEPNDISRLVAHNYLKIVDAGFPDGSGRRYLRYVDDTTIFTTNLEQAHDIKRRHHMALRAVGLNPNAAKSEIMSVEEYEQRRHREINLRIDNVDHNKSEVGFNVIVREWYQRKSKEKQNWDRVVKRLYSIAGRQGWQVMKRHAVKDLQETVHLTEAVVQYLLRLENADRYIEAVFTLWNQREANTERLIHFARFLCDGSFTFTHSDRIAHFAVGRIIGDDDRPGSGYARGLLLLALDKHGKFEHRKKILNWASVETLKDEQLRLHFLYVFLCRGELDEVLRATLTSLISSDTKLLLSLCERAKSRTLTRARKILSRYIRVRATWRTVEARILPLLRAMVESRNRDAQIWIQSLLTPVSSGALPLRDLVLLSFLRKQQSELES